MPLVGERKRQWNRDYYRRDHAAESARSIKKRKDRIAMTKRFLRDYLASHPCVDCGEADSVVLEFDHREPALKLFSMAEARRGKLSLAMVMVEVGKCDVRCANCHRRRTARQIEAGEIIPGQGVKRAA